MTADARACAARVLSQVISDGRSLSEALPAVVQVLTDARQRALVQELSYGTLRWFYRLDALLQRLLKKPLKQRDADVRCVLLLGLYQLDQLAMPQRVAVNETVQATHALNKQWASGLVNAVLRNYQRQAAQLHEVIVAEPVARFAHPAWLIEQLQSDWPRDWERILTANNARPPFSLRVNRQRVTRTEYMETLTGQSLQAQPLDYVDAGIRLDKPVPVDALPGFAEGYISVQDGAAQLAAGLLDLQPGQRVLDACAAPGGKTAHILESEPALAQVTAVDVEARRLARISENLSRLSLGANLVQGDAGATASWWDGQGYDRILLDVPCSATGVIRRHPDIKLLRRAGDIAALVSVQAQLLQAMWPLLSSGGMLLYCTCSVLKDENSAQIGRFLETHADAAEVPIAADWGRECRHGRQIFPGENEMDGFYFACLTRTA
ncbi:MAG: 16S rRNA (cytosine(967)-C(5))-methyltransferase RsmB [Gammaproteobacteria bacterium]|jgi:16S rRNA (cytosine967-C5)-methyltransferase|nr:16S rRNA (cytosine(967)-C(5))-methyltransferase RsmB [Gammaproteobacteria bacterium]